MLIWLQVTYVRTPRTLILIYYFENQKYSKLYHYNASKECIVGNMALLSLILFTWYFPQ